MDDIPVPISSGSGKFLNHLAVERHVSPSTQKAALNAVIYMYRSFLGIDLPKLNFRYAKVSLGIPVVFTHQEATTVISHLAGTYSLIVNLHVKLTQIR